jgi:HAD superfamily hydrolase (TIGR01509 family)
MRPPRHDLGRVVHRRQWSTTSGYATIDKVAAAAALSFLLTKPMPIRGAIFDFNGTLVFDSELHESAWRQFSFQIRGRALDERELRAHVHGRVNRDILGYVTGRALSEREVEQLAAQKEQLYRSTAIALGDAFRLVPGVEALLDEMNSKSVPMTIATASDINNLTFFVKHLKLDRWFDIDKIVYDDGTFPGKPEPDIFLRAFEKIGLSPDECVVVEDSISGLTSARRARAGSVIAIAPKHRQQEILDSGAADLAVETFEGLDLDRLFRAARRSSHFG